MSLKRRLLLLTEAQFGTVLGAMGYVHDTHDTGQGDGDISNQWARANDNVRDVIKSAPIVAPKGIADDLATVLHAACENSCSCTDRQASNSGELLHAPDCWNTMHRRAIDRIYKLRELLSESAAPRVTPSKEKA